MNQERHIKNQMPVYLFQVHLPHNALVRAEITPTIFVMLSNARDQALAY
jgi:hypothetical protein